MINRLNFSRTPVLKRLLISLLLGILLFMGTLWTLQGDYRPLPSIIRAATGEVYCVTPTPGGTFIGCDAVFTNVQAAVDMASGGEEIRVAGGTYTDLHQVAGLTQTVYLTKSVVLRGGYSPGFTAWDPASFETILDAQGQGRVFHLSGGISTTIEGFTITGGNATSLGAGALASTAAGGGLFIDGVTATLSHNRIHHNLANDGLATPANAGYGGGLYSNNSVIRMEENTVYENKAFTSPTLANRTGSGGGLHFDQSKIEFINNTVLSNTAAISGVTSLRGGKGGGIAIYGSAALLNGNLIERNVAAEFAGSSYGGGVYLQNNEVVTITNNQIRHNVANKFGQVGYGGGIANLNQRNQAIQNVIDRLDGDESPTTMADLIPAQQTGPNEDKLRPGVGDEQVETTLVLLDNLIENNLAGLDAAGIGGGAYLSDVYDGSLSGGETRLNVRLERNRVLSNTSNFLSDDLGPGGGMVILVSNVSMQQNIFRNNEARGDIGIGGGLYLYNSDAWLTNTVFLANRASLGGSGLVVEGATTAQVRHATFNQHDSASTIYIFQDTTPSPPQLPSSISMTNVIIADSPVGVQVTNENTLAMDHVLWYHTLITVNSTISVPPITITNEINGYPYFAADGYHLTGSPHADAIGRGTWAGVRHDIDGEPRRSPPDIGSDEYWEVVPTPRIYLPVVFK